MFSLKMVLDKGVLEMKLNLESQGNIIKKVNVEMNPTEFMLFRHILNLGAIHTELHEMDGRLASEMYHEIEDYLKEVSK